MKFKWESNTPKLPATYGLSPDQFKAQLAARGLNPSAPTSRTTITAKTPKPSLFRPKPSG
jgi:hypothetical protein